MSPDVGKMIKDARQARGITLRALAGQVGIHFTHLSKIENGKDKIGRESLAKIAEELGVDPDLMLGEAGHQAPPFRLLGNIAAGQPIEAIEDVETFDLTKVFDPHEHFLLRVRGTSMILDGINDGDLGSPILSRQIFQNHMASQTGPMRRNPSTGTASLRRLVS